VTSPPDGTPWWAWALTVLVLAVVPTAMTWLMQRGTRRQVTATQAQVAQTNASVGVIREQVQNTHTTNLRDELDGLVTQFGRVESAISDLTDGQAAMRDDIGGVHSEIRDVRRDVVGIRTDARRDRRALADQRTALDEHLAEVPGLVEQAVTRAETAHIVACPLRTPRTPHHTD